jgi:hypothetical protein
MSWVVEARSTRDPIMRRFWATTTMKLSRTIPREAWDPENTSLMRMALFDQDQPASSLRS